MFEVASRKLGLDHVVLDGGEMANAISPDDLERMLRHGAYSVFADDDNEIDTFCSADIDQILERRSKVWHEDVVAGGGSVFSKAQFNADPDELNSAAFWQQVIPDARSNPAETRRTRRPRTPEVPDMRLGSLRTLRELIDRGFHGGREEEIILRIAVNLQKGSPDAAILLRFPPCDLSNIEDPVREFGDAVLTIEPRAERLVHRVAYFVRLTRALAFAQGDGFSWPSVVPIWEDPSLEYSLMVGVFRYGWRDFESAVEDRPGSIHSKAESTGVRLALSTQ
jgi:hypothetical protein